MKMILIATVLTLFCVKTGFANIRVDFVEGAPKDRFIIKNIGTCKLVNLEIEVDLSNSSGKLFFDTTNAGAGVEVFQPFESGSEKLVLSSTTNNVDDGDQRLLLKIQELASNESVSFTIDVDDAMVDSRLGQIRVAGEELAGAIIKVDSTSAKDILASFSTSNSATAELPACT